MSAKTGVAPVSATEFAVAAKVNDGTMTSSPGPTPAASRPRCRPDVPELTATQVRPSTSASANSCSKAATSGPWATMPERSTRSTAARSSSPMIGLAAGMNVGRQAFSSPEVSVVTRVLAPVAGQTSEPSPSLLQRVPGAADPADLPGGDARDQREGGHVLGHDRAGGDHRPGADPSPVRRRPRGRRSAAPSPMVTPTGLPVVRRDFSEPSGLTARG